MNILLSRAEAAKRLNISLATFDRIYKKCGLPYIVIGHSVKVPEKELEAELHPDENGKLSPIESLQACNTINYIAETRETVRGVLEATGAMRKKAVEDACYIRSAPDAQAEGDSLQDQKEAAAEYAAKNGNEPFVVDYRAGYDFIISLQNELAGQHHDAEIGCLDYKVVKALAATYELQGYLANRIAQAVATGELEPDEEE